MNRYLFALAFAAMMSGSEPASAASGLDGASMTWPWSLPFIGNWYPLRRGLCSSRKCGTTITVRLHSAGPCRARVLGDILWNRRRRLPLSCSPYFEIPKLYPLALCALYRRGRNTCDRAIQARPWTNAGMLALGTSLASMIGTTGAAMILVRPMIRANEFRTRKAHVIIFFIILVANVGGALTPLGDPPLFIGFLHGVGFFWTAKHLWLQTLIVAVVILAIFLALDTWHFRKESVARSARVQLGIRGQVNFFLISIIIGAMLASAAWKPGFAFDLYGSSFELQNLVRDAAFIVVALVSLWLTPEEHRAANGFSWEPIREVAILFAGIFVTIIPVEAMLRAGSNGAFAFLLQAVTAPGGGPHEVAYFWLTGALSALLDNAPTYLVFFELAGGNPSELMGPLAGTLASISMGAVYMGAWTYIGNAPNFMVYAIAEESEIRMPSFFGYMLWAGIVLVPLFVLLTLLPIAPLLRLQ